jgi:sucrose-6-phosphate hydrolase SacC (GH32 family)
LRWRGAAADRVALRVLFDRSTLEVFANDGETVISDRVFPTQPLTRLEVVGAGTAVPAPAQLHALDSVWR